jgi:hypothetical protein
MSTKLLSNYDISLRGQLTVNLPVTLIMLLVFILVTLFETSLRTNVLIVFVSGWISWSFLVKNWIKWAVKNNVDEERLYKIGKSGLLIWSKFTIETVTKKNRPPLL